MVFDVCRNRDGQQSACAPVPALIHSLAAAAAVVSGICVR